MIRTMHPPMLIAIGAVALSSAATSAQQGLTNGFQVDVQAKATAAVGYTANGLLGVTVDSRNHYYVTGRRDTASTANPHMLFEFDAIGDFVAAYAQPAATLPSAWGIRDLAYDGRRYLYGGLELAISTNAFAFDTQTGMFDPTKDITVIGAPGTAIRALAYDATGDGGLGSFWSGDFSTDLFEFSATTGAVLLAAPNVVPVTYGAGLDPETGNVWYWGQGTPVNGRPGQGTYAVEVDQVGNPTGQQFYGDTSIPGTFPGGVAGGCDFYYKGGRAMMIVLTQATSDTIYDIEPRFNYGVGCGGIASYSGGAPWAGNANFALTLNGCKADMACVLISLGEDRVPLPGLTKCDALVRLPPIQAYAVPVTAGNASVPLPVPTGIPHGRLYCQWVIHDLPLPVSLSNGGRTRIYP